MALFTEIIKIIIIALIFFVIIIMVIESCDREIQNTPIQTFVGKVEGLAFNQGGGCYVTFKNDKGKELEVYFNKLCINTLPRDKDIEVKYKYHQCVDYKILNPDEEKEPAVFDVKDIDYLEQDE